MKLIMKKRVFCLFKIKYVSFDNLREYLRRYSYRSAIRECSKEQESCEHFSCKIIDNHMEFSAFSGYYYVYLLPVESPFLMWTVVMPGPHESRKAGST